jgi:hypothetical protein
MSSVGSRVADDPTHLLHGGDQRVDLHRLAGFQILQHRGSVLANLGRAIDPALDINPETGAQALGNYLRLQHHRLGGGAAGRIAGNDIEGAPGQRRDRVETQVAPQLQPQLGADVVEHRGFETGLFHDFGNALDARRGRTVGLAQRELVAVDVLDNAGRGDLGRRVDRAADCPVRANGAPLAVVAIDRINAVALIGAGKFVKIPPRHTVLAADDRSLRAEERRHRLGRLPSLMRFEAIENHIDRANLGWIAGGQDIGRSPLAVLDQRQAIRADRRKVGTARDHRNLDPGDTRQPNGEISANGTGAKNTNLHTRFLLRCFGWECRRGDLCACGAGLDQSSVALIEGRFVGVIANSVPTRAIILRNNIAPPKSNFLWLSSEILSAVANLATFRL